MPSCRENREVGPSLTYVSRGGSGHLKLHIELQPWIALVVIAFVLGHFA